MNFRSTAKSTVWLSTMSGLILSFQNCGSFKPISNSNQASTSASSKNGETMPAVSLPGELTSNGVQSVSANSFLASLGINTHLAQGVSASSAVAPLKFLGIRNIRDGDAAIDQLLIAHEQSGVVVNLIGDGNLFKNISDAKILAAAGALLSLEGPNEPNNFGLTYNGIAGGHQLSWMPVASYQRDLFSAVKSDPVLKNYPVFSVSEQGAEFDNVGLQFLRIPAGSNSLLPEGTAFADFATVHNYVSSTQHVHLTNMAWDCADPTLDGIWDGLHTEYGVTWYQHFKGYADQQLTALPRVTTETGWDSVSDIGGEPVQGVELINAYLAQFKRGWAYTFIYMLRDGEGGTGNQGVFNADSTPKLAATYIHNLTAILADSSNSSVLKQLNYTIPNQPKAVHDLLLQKSNGHFELVIWGENATGSSSIIVSFSVAVPSLKVYDVTSGSSPIQTLSNVSKLPLTLTDHPLVLEL